MIYELENTPPEISKKVALFKHFCNFFKQNQPEKEKIDQLKNRHRLVKDNFLDRPVEPVDKTLQVNPKDIEVELSMISLDLVDPQMVNRNQTTAYIKRFVRTKHGILFKLNDMTVQQVLYDGSEMILDSSNKRVITIMRGGQVEITPLKIAIDRHKFPESSDMCKRLVYMKHAMALI